MIEAERLDSGCGFLVCPRVAGKEARDLDVGRFNMLIQARLRSDIARVRTPSNGGRMEGLLRFM